MIGVLEAAKPAAVGVVEALARHTATNASTDSGSVRSAATATSATPRLVYAEVIVTLPASAGARLDPWVMDDMRADLVRAVENAGAVRATAIVLVNPSEIAPRLTVLALVNLGDVSAAVGQAAAEIAASFDLQVPDVVLAQPVVVDELRDVPTTTLTPDPVAHRVDVLLAWSKDAAPTERSRS